jgi:rhomboid protease GluP
MQNPMTRIAARSQKQAMDWSLVLVSQGIESVIEPSEGGGWSLLIEAKNSEVAFKTLRQYQVENRGWPWRQALPWPESHFDWLSFAWAALLVFFHWVGSVQPTLYDRGMMDSKAVLAGQWWRIFTAVTLHKDVAHLGENLSIGVVLFGLAMGRYGTGTGLLAAYAAGICGNLASLWLNAKPFSGLGASGMVMGALGLLAAQTILPDAQKSVGRRFVGVGAAVLLFILYGFSPGADTAAHIGGFVAGLVLGMVLIRLPEKYWRSLAMNLTSGLLLLVLVGAAWCMALFR